jgi:tryptophanyl-tRNA synthetase
MYGREPGFEDKAREAVKKLGGKKARLYEEMRTRFQQDGDKEAIEQAHAMLNEIQHLSAVDRERLFGYLEGTGKMILVEPGCLADRGVEDARPGWPEDVQVVQQHDHHARIRGIGGQEGQEHADRSGRVRRTDPGDPAKCPVWQLHQVYSNDACKEWVQQGCRSAGIGCIECKQPVIDGILREQAPMRERAQMYLDDPTLVKNIIADGCEKARELARETMRDVRESMGLEYH